MPWTWFIILLMSACCWMSLAILTPWASALSIALDAWPIAALACCWTLLATFPARAPVFSMASFACFCSSLAAFAAWTIASSDCFWIPFATFWACSRTLTAFFPASLTALFTALLMVSPIFPKGFHPPNYNGNSSPFSKFCSVLSIWKVGRSI